MQDTLVVRRSRSNYFYMQDLTALVVGVALAVWLTVGGGSMDTGSRNSDYLLAGIGLLGAALAVWQNLWPAWFDRSPILTLDGSGIHAPLFGCDFIPWAGVSAHEFKLEWAPLGWRRFLYLHRKPSAGKPEETCIIDTRDFDIPWRLISEAIDTHLRASA